MSNTDEYLSMLKKGIKNIEEELDSMNSIIEKLEQPDDPRLVKDIDVNWIGTKLFEVTWTPVHENAKIDIQFYDRKEEKPWRHSVLMYHPSGSISAANGSHKIGLGGKDTDKHDWGIRIVGTEIDWQSDEVLLDSRSNSGGSDEPEKSTDMTYADGVLDYIENLYEEKGIEAVLKFTEGDDRKKVIELVKKLQRDDSEEDHELIPVFTRKYARVRGVIDWKGGTRIYAWVAEGSGDDPEGIYAFDSKDLKNWKESHKPDFHPEMKIFQDPDSKDIYGFTSDGDKAYMWDDFNPDKGCENRVRKIFEWRQDGTLAPSKNIKGFIQLGRIRGYGETDEGHWDKDDLPKYPDIDNYPVMRDYWKEKGRLEVGRRWVKDRRGVSLHTSDDGKDWDSRPLLDPKDVNLKGFKGWNQKDKDGIGDFYSAVMIDDRRCFLKVYWKEKDRFIDRFDYVPEDKQDDYKPERRFRFTGETTFIPAVLEDGELKIKSTESVIPKKFHERIVTKEQVPWATNPGVPEVGQLTPHNRVIFRDGYAYITYYYRDDIHYEGGWDKQNEGVFIYKMPEDEFNKLFE